MDRYYCAGLYIVISVLIGWYIWFRDEGKDAINDVLTEDLGLKKKSQSEKSKLEYQKWWDTLSEEEQEEVIKTTHNPGGEDHDQEF